MNRTLPPPFQNISRIILFGLCLFGYLYLGYHIRDYVINFTDWTYTHHPGVIETDYINELSDLPNILSGQSRWPTNIVVTSLMILLVSVMVYLIFMVKRYFWIALIFYSCLVVLCVCLISLGALSGNSGAGYEFARFIKEQLIHTPFVFILLVASLKTFLPQKNK